MKDRRDFIILSTALLSGMFTFFFFKDLIGIDQHWKWFAVGGLTVLTIVAMDEYAERMARTGNKFYFLPIFLCILTSVLGTVGSLQIEVQKQVESSKSYLRKESARNLAAQQVEKWQEASSNKDISAWALVQGQKAQEQLDKHDQELAEMSGGKAVNAFSMLADRLKTTSEVLMLAFFVFLAVGTDTLHVHLYADRIVGGPRPPKPRKSGGGFRDLFSGWFQKKREREPETGSQKPDVNQPQKPDQKTGTDPKKIGPVVATVPTVVPFQTRKKPAPTHGNGQGRKVCSSEKRARILRLFDLANTGHRPDLCTGGGKPKKAAIAREIGVDESIVRRVLNGDITGDPEPGPPATENEPPREIDPNKIIRKSCLQAANAQIRRNKQERMRMLQDYLEEYPDASLTEMATAVGVSSRETVRKYLQEMRRGA